MTKLVLKPVDTFFFKNQHTTEAGTDTMLSGIFPPRPNTIYGALRAAYIHEYMSFYEYQEGLNPEVKKWMGTPREFGDFHIEYCGLHYDGNSLLPLPLDHQVLETESGATKAYPLSLCIDELPSSQESIWRLMSNRKEKSKSSANQYAVASNWKESLLNHQPMTQLLSLSHMLAGEQKVGIALDYTTYRAKEHLLYQMTKWRFRKEGAIIVYSSSCPNYTNIHFARIGGENRPWIVQQENNDGFVLWNEEQFL